MFELIAAHPWLASSTLVGLGLLLFLALASTVVIGEGETGLVIRRYGSPLPAGRLIAIDGEAGYQAALLPPGWHLFLWPWRYKIQHVPLTVIRPGEIAVVVAADGVPVPPERILGKEVECNRFQNAEGFLRNGGERGRQLAILTAGTYRINPALFQVITAAKAAAAGMRPEELYVQQVPPERVGIVTALDGRGIATGDLAGSVVKGHEGFQRGQKFIDAGGRRGLQEEVLLSGAWNLNPWLVRVEQIQLTEIPIGHVGVVVSYVGGEHLDVSGDTFTHGDLVDRGRKGVWVEPLLPGKHPINTRVMKVELVPTTNIVLNWANRTEAHKYDERLASIVVRSKDGFSFNLDVSQIIHVGAKNAPRVISRVGSMQNLVDHVLQPTVGNYFRNSAQEVTVLEFLSARTLRQSEAFGNIEQALAAYDVECIDTLIGDILPPAELMKTQTDRKIAEELQRTYEVQRMAQVQRQALERETSVANLQAEVVRSEQMVRICEQNAQATAASAKGEAAAMCSRAGAEARGLTLRGEAEAGVVRAKADAEAAAVLAVGQATAEAYRVGTESLGAGAFTAVQLATVLGQNGVKLVPDVAVSGAGAAGGLAEALLGKLLLTAGDGPRS